MARQSAGYFFRPYELTVNPENPNAENYSILSNLESYRAPNTMFTFKLHYPCNNVSNIWMQNNNPATETSGVCCYKPLVIESEKLGWAGLRFNGRTALMDGTVYCRQSYYSVGAFFDFNGGVPGFLPLNGVQRVELYVLPPSFILFKVFNIKISNNYIADLLKLFVSFFVIVKFKGFL